MNGIAELGAISRASLIEAIYRISLMLSKSGYNPDNKALEPDYLTDAERKQVSSTVAEIVSEIESEADASITDLPSTDRSRILATLYLELSKHIVPPDKFGKNHGKQLLKELHAAD